MTKAYYRLDVRLEYYKYRCELFDKLSEDIDGHLARLDEDRQLVSAANEQLKAIRLDVKGRDELHIRALQAEFTTLETSRDVKDLGDAVKE